MAKRVAVLETLAVELFKLLHATMPAEYREESTCEEDYIWHQRHAAYGSVAKAVTHVAYLGGVLRRKAGQNEIDGPAWEFMEEVRTLGEPTCEDIAREMGLFEG